MRFLQITNCRLAVACSFLLLAWITVLPALAQNRYNPNQPDFYTRPKVVTSRWPDPSTNGVDLGFPRND